MNERVTIVALILLGLGVVFVIFNPFGWLEPEEHPLPELEPEQISQLVSEIEQGKTDPYKGITDLFQDHQIVMAGELGVIKNEVDFIANLLPRLPNEGVRILGVEHLLASDQQEIDELINAPEFQRDGAEELLMRRLVTWGYDEYVKLLESAWRVNNSSDGPFRVLGLNVFQSYSHLNTTDDFRDPKKLRQVMEQGNPDEFIARTIESSILEQGESALIFVDREKAFTDFLLKSHAEEMQAIGIEETRQSGKILADRYGDRIATVLFHSPWPSSFTTSRAQYPVNGLMDAAIETLKQKSPEEELFPFAVPMENMPETGSTAIAHTNFAIGYNSDKNESSELRFRQMTDLYIVFEELHNLDTATAIPDFVNPDNTEFAVSNFPGTRYENADSDDVNDFIRRFSEDRKELLERFND